MRKTMLVGTVVAAVCAAALALPANAAAPGAGEPTCLQTTSVAKGTLCTQLVRSGDQVSATATYRSAGTDLVTLVVSVDSGGLQTPAQALTSNTMTGMGDLTATSAPVTPPADATLVRACAKLTWTSHQGYLQVCSDGNQAVNG
jgi:hypothetical protein